MCRFLRLCEENVTERHTEEASGSIRTREVVDWRSSSVSDVCQVGTAPFPQDDTQSAYNVDG